MSRQNKLIIAAFLILVPVCLVLYLNYLLDNIISGLYVPQVKTQLVSTLPPDSAAPDGSGQIPGKSNSGSETSSGEVPGAKSPSSVPAAGTPSGSGKDSNKLPTAGVKVDNPQAQDIAGGVQEQINKPLEKKDLLNAAVIILKKLSWDEIEYLYQSGSKASRTAEEERKIRSILLAKLSPEDTKVLRELGAKYGKKLEILDPNVPIRD